MHLSSSPVKPGHVRKRCVFYLSGFDPKGAAHYHALYRAEAYIQAQLSGLKMQVGVRQKTALGNSFWEVSASSSEGRVETQYMFLRWDDIVREHWPRSRLQLLKDLFSTTWLNLRTGTLWRMFKLSWPPAVALFAPFLLLCAVLVGTPLSVALIMWLMRAAEGWATTLMGTAVSMLWLALAVLFEKKYGMTWLLRSYTFTAAQAAGRVPKLDKRLELHAETLLQRINSRADDEVLIVGHSSGTIMAVSVLAKALSHDPELGSRGPVISLLTLGQCMPMLGCLPEAKGFRGDLQRLSSAEAINWLDFSAPPDGCCFALKNPLVSCGVFESEGRVDRPKLLSPRFVGMFAPNAYNAMKQNKHRMHFQYLMAAGNAVKYDFFAITAGHYTLAHRFKSEESVQGYSKLSFFGG